MVLWRLVAVRGGRYPWPAVGEARSGHRAEWGKESRSASRWSITKLATDGVTVAQSLFTPARGAADAAHRVQAMGRPDGA